MFTSKNEWSEGVEFTLHNHNVEQLINDIEKWGKLYEGVKGIIDKVDNNINVWTNTKVVMLQNDQWTKELNFPLDKNLYDSDSLIDEVRDFFDLQYIPVKAQ
jgi:archaellum component FlaC